MPRSSKGSAFERKICGELSLWWTNGQSDAVFWRTSNSGGRSTVRGRKGKQTAGHYGDICITDPVGLPFLEVVTLELKRGYPKATIHDCLDQLDGAADQVYEQWVEQAKASQVAAGSYYWMIIHQRDRRKATVTVPYDFGQMLQSLEGTCVVWSIGEDRLSSFLWDDFRKNVTEDDIRIIKSVEKAARRM